MGWKSIKPTAWKFIASVAVLSVNIAVFSTSKILESLPAKYSIFGFVLPAGMKTVFYGILVLNGLVFLVCVAFLVAMIAKTIKRDK